MPQREVAGEVPLKEPRRVEIKSAFLRDAELKPAHNEPTAENTTIRSSRMAKEIVARKANQTLQAAIQAGDWKSVQASADLVSQMARWLQLSDEQIAANS